MSYSDKEKEREYQKKYHLKTWNQRKLRHQKLKRIRRNKLADWLRIYKKDLKCIKCGESHPACLDFHHVDSKKRWHSC